MFARRLLGLALGVLAASPVAAQSVDDLIAKNLEAKGGLTRMRAVKSLRMTGLITIGPGMEAPVTLEIKRPNMMRLEFTIQGMTGTQAFDGKAGWMLMPFAGSAKPEPMPPDVQDVIAEQADVDGPLVDYKDKGHTVELVGKEAVEGTDTYKIKVTTKKGTVRHFYLDAEYFLEVKEESRRTVRGTEIETDTIYGDYKEVDGLMMAHSIDTGQKGAPQRQKITIQKVELNVDLDDARFKMPEIKQ